MLKKLEIFTNKLTDALALMFLKSPTLKRAALALCGLKRSLSNYLNNLYVRCASVFVATGISDYVWANYMGSVAKSNPVVASNWAFLVIVLGAFVVVSYVSDRRLILPAAIGAWIGTYLAI